MVCNRKENYIVHLVLGRLDDDIEKSYELSSSLKVARKEDKIKEEPYIKKESKRPLLKKVKQEPKVKVCLYNILSYSILLILL